MLHSLNLASTSTTDFIFHFLPFRLEKSQIQFNLFCATHFAGQLLLAAAATVVLLTEVLAAPDVHCRVVLAQVVEPRPVNHKEPTCDNGGPAGKRGWGAHTHHKDMSAHAHTHTQT